MIEKGELIRCKLIINLSFKRNTTLSCREYHALKEAQIINEDQQLAI